MVKRLILSLKRKMETVKVVLTLVSIKEIFYKILSLKIKNPKAKCISSIKKNQILKIKNKRTIHNLNNFFKTTIKISALFKKKIKIWRNKMKSKTTIK